MLMPLRQSVFTRWLPEHLCPYLAGLLILTAAVANFLFLATGTRLDLSPDEAHYWEWATGSLTFAVRAPAVICGGLLLGSLYVLTVEVFGRPRLGLAMVAFGLTLPLVMAGSTLMTIDSPYTCCWGWALVFALT